MQKGRVKGKCRNGDAKIDNDGTPSLFWNGRWSPICGHHFWDNDSGANLFCQKLGYASGSVTNKELSSSKDAIALGNCEGSISLLSCCYYGSGTDCDNTDSDIRDMCKAGNSVGMTITCQGRTEGTYSSSCQGMQNIKSKACNVNSLSKYSIIDSF